MHRHLRRLIHAFSSTEGNPEKSQPRISLWLLGNLFRYHAYWYISVKQGQPYSPDQDT